jgi:hypothetical protein
MAIPSFRAAFLSKSIKLDDETRLEATPGILIPIY